MGCWLEGRIAYKIPVLPLIKCWLRLTVLFERWRQVAYRGLWGMRNAGDCLFPVVRELVGV